MAKHTQLQAEYGVGLSALRRWVAQFTTIKNDDGSVVSTDTSKNSDNEARINIIKQDFYPIAPNKAWCTDITYIRVNGSWNYLTTIMDLFSRKIVGWSFSSSLKAEKTIIRH